MSEFPQPDSMDGSLFDFSLGDNVNISFCYTPNSNSDFTLTAQMTVLLT